MKQIFTAKKRLTPEKITSFFILSIITLFILEPAFAAGGLDKVNTFVDNVLVVLRGVSVAVVTIAIMWAGYKFLFKHASMVECGQILLGGLLIGGAAELSRYLLG